MESMPDRACRFNYPMKRRFIRRVYFQMIKRFGEACIKCIGGPYSTPVDHIKNALRIVDDNMAEMEEGELNWEQQEKMDGWVVWFDECSWQIVDEIMWLALDDGDYT